MRRTAIVGLITVAILAVGAVPAWAHVTVSAPGATRGGSDQEITFRVPTEKDGVTTTGLKVALPTDTPIASVRVKAIPGWSVTQTTVKLSKPIVTDDGDITEAVSEITWTADSAADGIDADAFGEFTIIAGQLPDTNSLTFKAIQTYSDNSTVSWTDVAAPGSKADLEHPAPVLTLAKDSDGGGSSDTGAIILSIVALVVAVAAAGYAFVSRAKARSSS